MVLINLNQLNSFLTSQSLPIAERKDFGVASIEYQEQDFFGKWETSFQDWIPQSDFYEKRKEIVSNGDLRRNLEASVTMLVEDDDLFDC